MPLLEIYCPHCKRGRSESDHPVTNQDVLKNATVRKRHCRVSGERFQTIEIDEQLFEAITKNLIHSDDSKKQIRIASVNRRKFHHPDCTYAAVIPATVRLVFKDAREARANGYTACGQCGE